MFLISSFLFITSIQTWLKRSLLVKDIFLLLIPESNPQSSSRQNLDVKKHLNRLNKRPVKSIKSPDGDIIDCVLITHQPAFDHPSLKNHTIQMRPSYYPNSINVDDIKVASSKREGISQLWHVNGKCPEGTIPVIRIKEEDKLRANSVESLGKKRFSMPADRASRAVNHIHAIGEVKGEFHGTRATFTTWNHYVEPNDFSLAQLWILGGVSTPDTNTIEVGWHVYPNMNHNYNTRFFIFYTSDNYQSKGCYNLRCVGFVQTNKEMAIGAAIYPVSQVHSYLYDMTIQVWRDPNDGNWWLQLGGRILGYWPSIIFSHLRSPAEFVQWGGEVMISPNVYHSTTQMGSGQFAEQGFGGAGLIRNIQVVDTSYNLISPMISTNIEQPSCYDAQSGYNGELGSYVYYGGPGRNPYCP